MHLSIEKLKKTQKNQFCSPKQTLVAVRLTGPTRRRFDRRVAARTAVSGDDFFTTASSLPDLQNPGGGVAVGGREMLAVEQKQPRRLPPAMATLTGECGPPPPPMTSVLAPKFSSRRALQNPVIIFQF